MVDDIEDEKQLLHQQRSEVAMLKEKYEQQVDLDYFNQDVVLKYS